jgi:hypothetical protein
VTGRRTGDAAGGASNAYRAYQQPPLGGAGGGAFQGLGVPRFSKLEFPSYDGFVDPLNWLRRCEQFFRGQQTAPADRVWLASYHLKGVAQTWYYALEIDKGVPTWDRFTELCHQRFGPALRTNRLSELARLAFTGSVQEYQERFNELVCHTDDLLPHQKADLFIGGLPDHFRVDVELRQQNDLQTAMYLARAYERRAAASQLLSAPRLPGAPTRFLLPPPARAPPLALPAPSTGAPTTPAPPPA